MTRIGTHSVWVCVCVCGCGCVCVCVCLSVCLCVSLRVYVLQASVILTETLKSPCLLFSDKNKEKIERKVQVLQVTFSPDIFPILRVSTARLVGIKWSAMLHSMLSASFSPASNHSDSYLTMQHIHVQ